MPGAFFSPLLSPSAPPRHRNSAAHVQRYIPAGIHSLATAPEFDSVFVLTDGAPNRVYVYRYYWQTETEKAQSAWSHWTLDDDAHILHAKALGGYLYLLVDRPDGTYLERVALFHGSFAGGLAWQTYLDRRCELYGSYNLATDTTTFTVPYPVSGSMRSNFVASNGNAFADAKSSTHVLTWLSSTTFSVSGDVTAGPLVCGLGYVSMIRMSRQYPQNSRGEAIHTGRLQLKTFTVHFTDTAYFNVIVRPYGTSNSAHYITAHPQRRVNVSGLDVLGIPAFTEGKATVSVQANAAEAAIDLVSDSHVGFCFTSAEWEGFYHNRARA